MDNDTPSSDLPPFSRDAFVRTIREICLDTLGLSSSTRILVAVSGGADSVALYRVMRELGYGVEVGHFDHMTRDGASTRDARFVAAMAERDGVLFHTAHASVAAEASASGESFEMYARRLRYAFLLRTAQMREISTIATGHHADDQAETVLMRVVRGTTGQGLSGIPPVREEQGIRIVRPLLSTRRKDIIGYLQSVHATYCEDATNFEQDYVRNRVRSTLIPMLERAYNPQLVSALCRLAESQRVEHAWLDAAAEQAAAPVIEHATLDRAKFAALDEAIRRRVFQKYAWGLGVDCAYERVVAGVLFVTRADTGARFDLGSGVSLINGAAITEVAPQELSSASDTIALATPGSTVAFGRIFTVRVLEDVPAMPISEYCTSCRQILDGDTLGDLAVRRVHVGDRFTPFGMSGSRKLSDYLTDLKLAPSERAAQLVLTSAGRIIWVVGRAVSADAAVTAPTKRVVEVEIMNADL